MDNYLMRYGFTPSELGVNSYFAGSTKENSRPAQAKSMGNRVDFDNTLLKNLPLTMAYVPMQTFTERYAEDKALKAGTLFPDLDKPFLERRI